MNHKGRRTANERPEKLHEFARVQNAVGVKGAFDDPMEGACFGRKSLAPPPFFGKADAMFSGDRAAPANHLLEEIVKSRLAALFRPGLTAIDHDVGMDIPITRMAEARDGQTMLFLQPRREREQVFQAASRHDDVLIELGEPGVTQGVRKFTPYLPYFLALCLSQADFNEVWTLPANELLQGSHFSPDRAGLAIEFDN